MATPPDLYLIGVGIKGLRQISVEALEALRQSRVIFHLTNFHRKLKRINQNVVNQARMYWTDEPLDVVYERLIWSVMEEVKKGPGVASVIYGHPLFFDDMHAQLLRIAQRKGLRCIVIPGISSLDTLSIDLGIDYGEGLQVFEANDLVENITHINPALHTLVFQIAEFATETTRSSPDHKRGRFIPMQNYLMQFYPRDHRIVIAYSDDGDGTGTYLLRSRLHKLDSHRKSMFLGTTLYLPPVDS